MLSLNVHFAFDCKYLRDVTFRVARLVFVVGFGRSALARQYLSSIRVLDTRSRLEAFSVAQSIAFTPFAHFPSELRRRRGTVISRLCVWNSTRIRLLFDLIVIIRIETRVRALLVQRHRIRESNQFIDRVVVGARQNLRRIESGQKKQNSVDLIDLRSTDLWLTSTVRSRLRRRANVELTRSIVELVPVYSNVTPPYGNVRGYCVITL